VIARLRAFCFSGRPCSASLSRFFCSSCAATWPTTPAPPRAGFVEAR
jgi:hypothetical protein